MIRKLKFLSMALFAVTSVAIVTGCNDTLRQFIITVPKPGGQPATQANAVVLSTNPAGNGSNLHLDVSGDDIAAVVPLGVNPLFLGKDGATAVVINGDGTVSSYLALLAISTTVHTSILPTGSSGAIAGGTSSSGNFFITDQSSNDIGVFQAGVSAVTQTIPLTPSTSPVAIAGNAANSKMYVINNGSNNVTVVSTVDNTVIKTIPVGTSPIWGVMSADAVDVFVVNQGDGTVMVIDTTLDRVIPCTPGPSCNATTGAISVGNAPATASPNFAFFDPNRQRLYVNNTGENTISVIKADGINLGVTPQILPQLLANVMVSGAPTSVTALSDGSKAYAALGNCPAGTNHTNLVAGTTPRLPNCTGNLVSVIDATALRELRTIPVGSGAVSVDSSSDASRAYVISAHDVTTIEDNVHNPNCAPTGTCGVGGNCITAPCVPGLIQPPQTFVTPSVSIIRTSTDTVFTPPTDPSVISSPLPSFHVPNQDPNCTPAINPNFNKTVVLPCAEQTPFVVRMFP